MTQTLPVAQYANLHFVTPQLAIGGDLCSHDAGLAARQLAEIRELGITHVVDVRVEWSDLAVFAQHAPEIGYLHHGMDDAGQAVPARWFELAVQWVAAAWAQDPHANVWYAADALTWHHARTGTDAATAVAQRSALGAWREQNPLDVVRIIREQRARGL